MNTQLRGPSLRMLVLAAFALLPVLAVMAYLVWQSSEETIAKERVGASRLAELLAREQSLPFTLGRQLLHSVAVMQALAEPLDRAACSEKLKRVAASAGYLSAISLYSVAGDTLCSSAEGPSPAVGDRDWFRQALAEGRMVVSDRLVGRASGKDVLVMGLPLAGADGGVRAVLALGLDLAWIDRALATVPVAEGTNIVLVDGRGTVLAPARWLGRSVADHPVFRHVSTVGTATSFEAAGIDGEARIFVARPLNTDLGGHGYLWIAVPKTSAARAALQNFLGSSLLVLVTALVLVAAIWWEGRRVVLAPVRHLRDAAQRLGTSQPSARTNLPYGAGEIGQLVATFDDMAAKIELRERELERSRESVLRANRTLRVLSAVKDVANSAEDERALLDALCRAVARLSGCTVALVAHPGDSPDRPLVIAAQEGLPAAWHDRLYLPVAGNARDPAGIAMRTGRPSIIHDVRREASFTPWGELAADLNIETIIGLPVRVEGQAWGVLVLASTQAGVFDEEEARLLEELAADLGRGIETLRLRREKGAAEVALRRMMEELERRVAERTAKLNQVNRELEAFSYSISHDLRAPLRAIDGFAQALDEECGPRLDAACQDYLARVRAAAQRMGSLIDDMIGLARISNSEMVTCDVDLSALAAEIGAELAALESSRKVRFSVAPGMSVRGDPALLRALVQNLLENAWKYTARTAQPEIEFGRTWLASGEQAYFVRDNGAGFDMAFADRLFRPFSRLHRAEDYPGTGIGLATVARVASRHGGRAWAEAKKGQGATFYFVLGS